MWSKICSFLLHTRVKVSTLSSPTSSWFWDLNGPVFILASYFHAHSALSVLCGCTLQG